MEFGECVLCMDREVNVTFSCGHMFCEHCARDWLTRAASCPLCVQPVCRVNLHDKKKRVLFLGPHVNWMFSLRDGVVTYANNASIREGVRRGDRVAYINGSVPREQYFYAGGAFTVLDVKTPYMSLKHDETTWCRRVCRALALVSG